MKKSLALMAFLAVAALSSFTSTSSAQSFDQSITAIFGAGNPSTGWTVDTENGITLALRAKNRENGSTLNDMGVYSEPAGLVGVRARWNYEFSVNSGAVNLDQYDYYLGVDIDPSVGISHAVINAVANNVFADNSYGTSLTLTGQGVEPASLDQIPTLLGLYSVMQNSQNITFGGYATLAGSLLTTGNATWDYELYAVQKGAGPTADKLASVSITVVVGTGGASVQDLVEAIAADVVANNKSHGDYVTAIGDLVKYLNATGVINKKQRQTILTTAAQSSVGQ